jgi:hypothetical protein
LADLSQFDGYGSDPPDAGPDVDAVPEAAGNNEGSSDATGDGGAVADRAADRAADATADRTADAVSDVAADNSTTDEANADADAEVDACGITAPNLLANPGFECGISPWTQLGQTAVEVTTTVAHSGRYSCWATQRGAAYTGPTQLIVPALDAGQTYQGSAWTLVGAADAAANPDGADGSADIQTVQLTFYATCAVDAGRQYFRVASGTANTSSWTQITGSFTLPGTCTTPLEPGLYVEGPPAGVDLYVDDVVLQ